MINKLVPQVLNGLKQLKNKQNMFKLTRNYSSYASKQFNLASLSLFNNMQKNFSTCSSSNVAQQSPVTNQTYPNNWESQLIQYKFGPGYYMEQLYIPCISEYAYYIESQGEAVIIDPLRETEPYQNLLYKRNAKLKYILETHFHADFVSGHVDLSRHTGAKIVYGPTAKSAYPIHQAKDGEILEVGEIKIHVIHTPGHTMESSSFLLENSKGVKECLFSGDTIFLGEVGRPDLAVKSGEISEKDLAKMLYNSIYNKLFKLPDSVLIYPGHGAGSSCGKNIQKGHFCTLGNQKLTNYALKGLSEADFVNSVTHELPRPPQYFFYNAGLNKNGYEDIDNVLKRAFNQLDLKKFKYFMNRGSLVLDTRADITNGIIPNSLNVSIKSNFATFVGTLISHDINLLLVADDGAEEEIVERLTRIGYDNIDGFLSKGIKGWKEELVKFQFINGQNLLELANKQLIQWIDIRNKGEHDQGYVEGSARFPLSDMPSQHEKKLKKDRDIYISCASGTRAKIAASLLAQYGYNPQKLHVVTDGYEALVKLGGKVLKP